MGHLLAILLILAATLSVLLGTSRGGVAQTSSGTRLRIVLPAGRIPSLPLPKSARLRLLPKPARLRPPPRPEEHRRLPRPASRPPISNQPSRQPPPIAARQLTKRQNRRQHRPWWIQPPGLQPIRPPGRPVQPAIPRLSLQQRQHCPSATRVETGSRVEPVRPPARDSGATTLSPRAIAISMGDVGRAPSKDGKRRGRRGSKELTRSPGPQLFHLSLRRQTTRPRV
jgi:hypothetical protein